MQFINFEKISLKSHPEFNEKWVQDRIAADPSILGIGDVILKDKERIQPRAGRLDLLLQDADANRRYEVEIQLGATDESHIIRTIEYWDIERKRYPQYDHIAVIVAEDITSRFLNVISLFNGSLPLIAIQMNALKVHDGLGLFFTQVLNQMSFGLVEEEEEDVRAVTDRNYWENRGTKKTVEMADVLCSYAKAFEPSLELKYNKFYIGLAKDNQPVNFIIVRPKKGFLRFEPRLPLSQDRMDAFESAGLEADYDARWARYIIRLKPGDIEKHEVLIKATMSDAYSASNNS
jgi:hypothetical protein